MQNVAKPNLWRNFTQLTGAEPQAGEVGIEIEVEGKSLPTEFQYHWGVHPDGSLKTINAGDQAYEYVLRKPVGRKDISKVLKYFAKKWAACESTAYDSPRTSVHVHLNFQQCTQVQAVNMATLWYILEEPLVAWCGEERVNNLFCLRADDAEGVVLHLIRAIQLGNLCKNLGDNVRYAALNMAALAKYGSIEIRSLRGTVDIDVIEAWVQILLKIKDAALAYENPQKIIQEFSGYGAQEFAQRILGQDIVEALNFNETWTQPWDNMRLAQDLAYAVQWIKKDEPVVASYPAFEPGVTPVQLYVEQVKAYIALTGDNQKPNLPGHKVYVRHFNGVHYYELQKAVPFDLSEPTSVNWV